ncbi:hypothetical protein GCM10010140_65920 [Streptosporangium pseudovulgare]|uniref:Uncharacterized protein n=1 Tax=Streptosporangium pseudovulgare TaxID=35765 RepID=A0ABQ2RFD0_9ACTN|nr:hypothetical protein GCM10010140_65920 [Streptosporangium pseudovulgare]
MGTPASRVNPQVISAGTAPPEYVPPEMSRSRATAAAATQTSTAQPRRPAPGAGRGAADGSRNLMWHVTQSHTQHGIGPEEGRLLLRKVGRLLQVAAGSGRPMGRFPSSQRLWCTA